MRAVFTNLEIPQADAYNALFDNDQGLYHNLESALILFLTPNIERLSLNSTPGLEENKSHFDLYKIREPHAVLLSLLCAGQRLAYGKVHTFKNLKYLKLCMSGFHVNTISPVLRLESLKDLMLFDYCDHAFELDEVPGEWSCPPSTSTVENIRLDNFECDIQSVEDLLKSCRFLKTLALTTPSEYFLGWRWPTVKALLQKYQPCLRALKVRDCTINGTDPLRLGSLQEFVCLEYLAVALERLVGKPLSFFHANANGH